MKRFLVFAALLVAVSISFAGVAKADSTGTLTLTDCGGGQTGCPGAVYTFDIGATSATLSIQITGAVNGDNDIISGVNLGTDGVTITNLNVTGPNAGWTAAIGSVNSSSNCQKGNGSFMCAFGSVTITSGNTYTWTWTYDGIDASALGDVHIGTNYDPHAGFIVSQVVGGTTSTPEPASMLLLGLGLAGVPFLRRKRS